MPHHQPEIDLVPMKITIPSTASNTNNHIYQTNSRTGAEEPAPNTSNHDLPSGSGERVRSTWRITAILTALFLSLFVAALDVTIVATAVPIITQDLSSATGYTWIGGAYLLANASSGPIWVKLSDIWGRKPIMLAAVALFTAASAVCATAQSMRVLILGRALQGSASGGLILMVHVCISDLFSLRRRSLYMGLTEFIWASAGAVGPVLGGIFASLVSWRWCFYVNLPICGIAFALLLFFLDIKHEHTTFSRGLRALDWTGLITFLGFTSMLLLGLNFGGAEFPWSSAKVIALIVVGSLMILAFLYSEARVARYPLMPLQLFKDRSNVAALLVTLFHGFVFVGGEYYMPLYFQSVLEASPLRSGVLLLPLIVTTAVAGIVTGVIIHRTGRYRELIWVGTALLCLGRGLIVMYGTNTGLSQVVGFQVIAGIGAGLLFEPPLIAVQAKVEQSEVATATSTLSFIRNMALTVSTVVGGVIFQNSMDLQLPYLREAGLPDSMIEQLRGKNAAANVMLASTLADDVQELAVKQAFAWSFRNMSILYTVIAFLGLVASLFVMQTRLSKEHTETVTGLGTEKD